MSSMGFHINSNPQFSRSCRAGRTYSRRACCAGLRPAHHHVVHFDEHLGIFFVDPPGEFQVCPHVVLLGERHRMAVRRVFAAALIPVAVEHQVDDAVGAVGQQAFGGLVEIRLRAKADRRFALWAL